MSTTTEEITTTTLATLAEQINQAHDAAITAARTAIAHAQRCGELLIEAKAQVGHGGFAKWLAANCAVGERQARNYMTVAANWEQITNRHHGSDLTIKQALRLTRDAGGDDPLKGAEAGIESALAEQRKMGRSLKAIRDGRLYRETHTTFDAYCREKWDMDPLEARRLISLACAADAGRADLPTLADDLHLFGLGIDGRFAQITPMGGGYFYVGVTDIESETVDEFARGIIGRAVPSALQHMGFAAEFWSSEPAVEGDDPSNFAREARRIRLEARA